MSYNDQLFEDTVALNYTTVTINSQAFWTGGYHVVRETTTCG